MPPDASTSSDIWLLLADKLGDNAQARLLIDAAGLPYTLKTVLPRAEWVLGKPGFRPTLDHLDPERSDRLEPPWPSLIVTVGRRPTMAALWVKEQSGAGRGSSSSAGRAAGSGTTTSSWRHPSIRCRPLPTSSISTCR